VVSIEKLVAGGDGLVRMDDGRVVFVPGVVAGEKVEIDLVSTTNDFGRGRLLRVVEASPDRREPPCPHVADGCGGCDWQHIQPAAQHGAKVALVTEAFARTARMQIEPRLRVLDASARRSTVRMVADHNGVLGFREGESNETVRVASCMVAEQMVNDIIAAPLLEGAGEVTIRVSPRTGERGVWCHEGQMVRGLDESIARGARGVVHMEAAGHRYRVSMGSFFQSSEAAADLLVDVVTRRLNGLELPQGGLLVDAYGGVGLFSRALSSRFDEIVLVESNQQACRDAITNLEDCAAVIDQSNMEHWNPCRADVVVADPARQGLGKGGVAAIVDTEAPTVVLVSCDPVAGARDVRMLVDAGYGLGDVEVLDIFPETHHVEVVSVLTRSPG
jgi:23S rRNA (uracil1939-C5)-methyltransferase